MGKFQFSMNSVLKLRERVEEQKKQEFGKAMKKLENEKMLLAIFKGQKEKALIDFKANVAKAIDPDEPKKFNYYIDALKRKIEIQVININRATKEAEEKREELMAATQDKKKLEKLKEREAEEHLEEEKRSEQKTTDEIVSYQYHSC